MAAPGEEHHIRQMPGQGGTGGGSGGDASPDGSKRGNYSSRNRHRINDMGVDNPRRSFFSDYKPLELNIEEGIIPLLYGTRILKGHMIWWGNRQWYMYQDGKQEKMGCTISFALGVCMGEANLVRIFEDDNLVWTYHRTSVPPGSYHPPDQSFESDDWDENQEPPTDNDGDMTGGGYDPDPDTDDPDDDGDPVPGEWDDNNNGFMNNTTYFWYRGTSDQAACPVISTAEASGSGRIPRWKNLAYLVVHNYWLGDSDKIPDFSVEVFRDAWDWNPVDIIQDLLTNTTYGLGLTAGTYIDSTSFAAVKTYCTTKNILISPLFEKQAAVLDIIEYILKHHNGMIRVKDGKIELKQIKNETAVDIQREEMSESTFPISVSQKGSADIYNRVTVHFPKRLAYYEEKAAAIDDDIKQITEGVKSVDINLEYTKGGRAMQCARVIMEMFADVPEYYSFTLPISYLSQIYAGDRIKITDINYRMDEQAARITEKVFNTDLTISINATKEKDSDYFQLAHPDDLLPDSISRAGYPGKIRECQIGIMLGAKSSISSSMFISGVYSPQIMVHYAKGNRKNWHGADIYRSYDDIYYQYLTTRRGYCIRAKITDIDVTYGYGSGECRLYIEMIQPFQLATKLGGIIGIPNSSTQNLAWLQNSTLYNTAHAGWKNRGMLFRYSTVTQVTAKWEYIIEDFQWNLNSHPDSPDINTFAVDDVITLYQDNYMPFYDPAAGLQNGDTVYYRICSVNERGQRQRWQDAETYSITLDANYT